MPTAGSFPISRHGCRGTSDSAARAGFPRAVPAGLEDSADPIEGRAAPDMERPPSLWFLVGRTEGLGGRVTAGNSPAREGGVSRKSGAASGQPPHMSVCHSKSRTTSFPVYRRPYHCPGKGW